MAGRVDRVRRRPRAVRAAQADADDPLARGPAEPGHDRAAVRERLGVPRLEAAEALLSAAEDVRCAPGAARRPRVGGERAGAERDRKGVAVRFDVEADELLIDREALCFEVCGGREEVPGAGGPVERGPLRGSGVARVQPPLRRRRRRTRRPPGLPSSGTEPRSTHARGRRRRAGATAVRAMTSRARARRGRAGTRTFLETRTAEVAAKPTRRDPGGWGRPPQGFAIMGGCRTCWSATASSPRSDARSTAAAGRRGPSARDRRGGRNRQVAPARRDRGRGIAPALCHGAARGARTLARKRPFATRRRPPAPHRRRGGARRRGRPRCAAPPRGARGGSRRAGPGHGARLAGRRRQPSAARSP